MFRFDVFEIIGLGQYEMYDYVELVCLTAGRFRLRFCGIIKL